MIHVNFGLHDAMDRTGVEKYESNVRALHSRLRTHARRVIWATTTPVPPSYRGRRNADVVALNRRMAQLFGPRGKYPEVAEHDLYSEVVARCSRQPGSERYPEFKQTSTLRRR